MKLPSLKRFLAEDFLDQAGWIGKLFLPLNLFLNTIYQGLNNGLTFQDNLLSTIKQLSVSGATPQTSFKWNFPTQPIGIIILKTTQSDGTAAVITSAVTCDWSYSSGIISINNVTGLNSAHTYLITFLAIGG